jgi:hypothetical protein
MSHCQSDRKRCSMHDENIETIARCNFVARLTVKKKTFFRFFNKSYIQY